MKGSKTHTRKPRERYKSSMKMRREQREKLPSRIGRPTGHQFQIVADFVWGECVKLRANAKSERSGLQTGRGFYGLQAHHILKKTNRLLRYHRESGVTLLDTEHEEYEKRLNHDEQREWIESFPRDLSRLRADNELYVTGKIQKEDWPDIMRRLIAWRLEYTDEPLRKPMYIRDADWNKVFFYLIPED